MYRCRSLLCLLRERTVCNHTQVARCGFLNSRPYSHRHFSDSASVVNLVNEEESNDKTSAKNVTKTKLFSFDKIYEAEKTVPAAKEKKSGKADNVQEIQKTKVSPEFLEEDIQIAKTALKEEKKRKDSKIEEKKERMINDISQLEQTSSFDKNQDHLNEKKDGNNVFEDLFEDGKQIPTAGNKKTDISNVGQVLEGARVEPQVIGKDQKVTDGVNTDSGESIKEQAQEMKIEDENLKKTYDELSLHLLRDENHEAKITKMIFAMDNPSQVLYNLGLCFDAMLSTKKKILLIVCALQKLKSMEYYSFTPYLEKRLHDFLVKSSLISRIPLTDLLKILEFFLVGSSSDNKATETLLHELCWRLRRSSLKQTVDISTMVKFRVTTKKRKDVYELANERLKEVISETSTPKELLTLMYHVNDAETQRRAEEEVLNMLEALDCTQSYKLLNLLVKRKSSNFSLIQRVKTHLFSRPFLLDAEQLKNVFFICSNLHEQDSGHLMELSVSMLECIENESNEVSSSTLIAVLHSCSKLGWNNKKLSAKIMENLSSNDNLLENTDSKTLASLVMSLCHLNLDGQFGCKIARYLISEKMVEENSHLDIIKSLASIKLAEKGEVLSVLQPAFYQPILDKLKESPEFLLNNVKSKLLRLHGYLQEDLQESASELDKMASELRKQLQEGMTINPSCNFAKEVSKVITRIGPLKTYTTVNVVNRYGYTIDFELFVDKNLKAVRLDKTEGAQRVWIKVLPRNAFVVDEDNITPSPDTDMMMRHLQSVKDTAVIFVDYFKWAEKCHDYDHLLYMESLIKKAVKGDTNGLEFDSNEVKDEKVPKSKKDK